MRDSQTLVELGLALMHQAQEASDRLTIQNAVLYRDGLMIALLARRQLPLRSFAAITLDEHLVKYDQGWWLSFKPSDTKTNQKLEMSFPESLDKVLELYLEDYRNALIEGRRTAAAEQPIVAGLWIAKGGAKMGGSAISGQIRSRTSAAFGVPINPHLFRDCVARSLSVQDPNYVQMLATSEQH